VCANDVLDFAQLNTLSSNLDLSVDPAEKLELAISWAMTDVITCSVSLDLLTVTNCD
jgi:hypothetical protein